MDEIEKITRAPNLDKLSPVIIDRRCEQFYTDTLEPHA
jgi:hypothetical protein